jgi:hypothetical protein
VVVLVVAFAIVACGWDWTVVPKAGPDAGDGTCASNAECRPEEVCFFADHRCGAGQRGVCIFTLTSQDCADLQRDPWPACGCDGKLGSDECAVETSRVALSVDAPCPAPPDTFRCGYLFCPKSKFCFESRGPKDTVFFCTDWPCPEKKCECNPVPKCANASCTTDGDGNTLVVCPEPSK